MTTPLENVVSILHTTLTTVGGESVTYTQDSTTVSPTALPGSSAIVGENLDGTLRTDKTQMFIFRTSDLSGVEPRRGDNVTWGSRSFAVIQPDGERCYEYTDPWETMIRVYVKEIAA